MKDDLIFFCKMEDDLNFLQNERWPQFFLQNGRRPKKKFKMKDDLIFSLENVRQPQFLGNMVDDLIFSTKSKTNLIFNKIKDELNVKVNGRGLQFWVFFWQNGNKS